LILMLFLIRIIINSLRELRIEQLIFSLFSKIDIFGLSFNSSSVANYIYLLHLFMQAKSTLLIYLLSLVLISYSAHVYIISHSSLSTIILVRSSNKIIQIMMFPSTVQWFNSFNRLTTLLENSGANRKI